MSAANVPVRNASLEEERRAHEPSMEEILASIRRIIADDDGLPVSRRERLDRLRGESEREAAPEPPPAAAAAYPEPALGFRDYARPSPDDRPEPLAGSFARRVETFEAVEAVEEAPFLDDAPIEAFHFPEEAADSGDAGEEEENDEEDYDFAEAPAANEERPAGSDPAPALMSQDAAASIASHFQALAASMVINDSGLLHDYAKEMLRPMLKQWLDDNLPVIVERLVRAEIERVARSGRR